MPAVSLPSMRRVDGGDRACPRSARRRRAAARPSRSATSPIVGPPWPSGPPDRERRGGQLRERRRIGQARRPGRRPRRRTPSSGAAAGGQHRDARRRHRIRRSPGWSTPQRRGAAPATSTRRASRRHSAVDRQLRDRRRALAAADLVEVVARLEELDEPARWPCAAASGSFGLDVRLERAGRRAVLELRDGERVGVRLRARAARMSLHDRLALGVLVEVRDERHRVRPGSRSRAATSPPRRSTASRRRPRCRRGSRTGRRSCARASSSDCAGGSVTVPYTCCTDESGRNCVGIAPEATRTAGQRATLSTATPTVSRRWRRPNAVAGRTQRSSLPVLVHVHACAPAPRGGT